MQLNVGTDIAYMTVIDGMFLARAIENGLQEIEAEDWITGSHVAPEPEVGQRIARARYAAVNQSETLIEFDRALAHLTRRGESVNARVAGADPGAVEAALAEIKRNVPEANPDDKGEAEFSFWWATDHGPRRVSRSLAVPTFERIVENYGSDTARRLEQLTKLDDPGSSGQLILWHGDPGAGKTYAIRALAWEWRRWCDFHCVTDPDALFGANSSGYLTTMVTGRARDRAGLSGEDRWRCLVLEDTGELMASDAKQRTGQALSRLLNVVDGLLGQGFNLLVLVTTNEPISKLHPAVTRAGRCLAEIEFAPLSTDEANGWLERSGSTARVTHRTSLADLYALRAGQTVDGATGFGFAA